MSTETLIWLIPLPPLLAFALISLFTNRSRSISHWTAILAAGVSWALSMVVFARAFAMDNLGESPFGSSINWFPVGETYFKIGVHVDPLSAITLFFVAWTIFMIIIYSVGYHNFGQPEGEHDRPGLPPHGADVKDEKGHTHRVPSVEPMYSRFFAFIALFAFGMYALVVTDNLLTLYMAWEIMGLCSYLLIGFWYGKKSARDAAVKAFMVTRIGDMFMLLGMAALYSLTGTLNYTRILSNDAVIQQMVTTQSPVLGLSWAGLVGLLIFMGTVGKSAQFPLHVWLPDAMEGPTPVSAMIHAATMVSAGVYLSIRFFPLIAAGWTPGAPLTSPMIVVASIGTFTALFAASIAMAQNDIKRVLAYSTISQLGYMVAAIGIGAYVAAAFHLLTHAFFKALLFLGSGSVIHGMEHGSMHSGEEIDTQDMRNMGGLRKKMPVTFWTFLIGGLALSGFPFITAGFWSKDAIHAGAYNGHFTPVFVVLVLAAFLTAFYSMRQITMTFLGKPRSKSAEHAHETKWTMTLPLVILAVFAISIGWVGIEEDFPLIGGVIPNVIKEFLGSMLKVHGTEIFQLTPIFVSIVLALSGLTLGWLLYRRLKANVPDPMQKILGPVYKAMQNKYGFDEFYDIVFVKTSNWISETFTYRWIDLRVIDGILHGIAALGLGIGRVFRNFFDVPVINGAGDALGEGTRGLGSFLRKLQTGRVQQYMVIALAIILILGAIFYSVIGL
jgi:NADH-quinone oxidoreductase subunit L